MAGNRGGGDSARYAGPPVVELVETTSLVAGADALAAPIHDAMVQSFADEGSYATEGGPASYHIEASLAALTVTPGSPGLVECAVKLTMMRAPDLALVGFVDGKASVAAAAGDEQTAASDCVIHRSNATPHGHVTVSR